MTSPPTVIVRHRKERKSKCSLQPLVGRCHGVARLLQAVAMALGELARRLTGGLARSPAQGCEDGLLEAPLAGILIRPTCQARVRALAGSGH